jgi:hypothetical protein
VDNLYNIFDTLNVNSPMIDVESRNCTSGEELTREGKCKTCEKGTYLIQPPTDFESCIPCDNNADCFGGNRLTPNEGFYKSVEAQVVVECFEMNHCGGGNETNQNGTCMYGYTGFMCGSCI